FMQITSAVHHVRLFNITSSNMDVPTGPPWMNSVDGRRGPRLDCGTMRGGRRHVNLVEAAVELAGGVTTVARKLGVSRQAVYNWMAAGHMWDVTYRYV